MESALVIEVRSAARRKTLMVELMEPTAQVIAGGVKQNLKKKKSLETLHPKPRNMDLEPCAVKSQP
jgi:hypothetical protein